MDVAQGPPDELGASLPVSPLNSDLWPVPSSVQLWRRVIQVEASRVVIEPDPSGRPRSNGVPVCPYFNAGATSVLDPESAHAADRFGAVAG
jgi:hypothetical protein